MSESNVKNRHSAHMQLCQPIAELNSGELHLGTSDGKHFQTLIFSVVDCYEFSFRTEALWIKTFLIHPARDTPARKSRLITDTTHNLYLFINSELSESVSFGALTMTLHRRSNMTPSLYPYPFSIVALTLVLSSISFAQMKDESENPKSYMGTSSITVFSLGDAEESELTLAGDTAKALFDGMSSVIPERESVTGSEGCFLHYRDVKRGQGVSCSFERGLYECVIVFSDRTKGVRIMQM